jgi:hypothetical protein
MKPAASWPPTTRSGIVPTESTSSFTLKTINWRIRHLDRLTQTGHILLADESRIKRNRKLATDIRCGGTADGSDSCTINCRPFAK